MVSDATVIRVLHEARNAGMKVMVHAEHGDAVEYLQNELLSQGLVEPKYHAASRPSIVEAEATSRAITMAEIVGTSIYIVHVSWEESLEQVVLGRARGVDVIAETCPQYLFTDLEQLEGGTHEAAKFVFTPPPRHRKNRSILWHALGRNELQAISSDHSPWNSTIKIEAAQKGFAMIPNGAPGIEERMVLAYQGVVKGHIILSQFVVLTSTNSAKIFGLYPQKGAIEIDSDADIVLWDPGADRVISQSGMHHNVDHTIYEGLSVKGALVTVLSGGSTWFRVVCSWDVRGMVGICIGIPELWRMRQDQGGHVSNLSLDLIR